jgi:hypothetical protein
MSHSSPQALMPNHNNFHGHIAWADYHSKVGPRKRHHHSNAHLTEYNKEISDDGKTVTCYIAAETGRFFAGTWWCNDKNPSIAQPYTAEFICDGESVHFAGFDRKAAATIQGIAEERMRKGKHYYFMFRSMDVAGMIPAIFWVSMTNS